MKKIFVLFIALVILFPLVGKAVELDNKNLKGIKYLRIQCEFNGIPYYKGFKSPKDQKVAEFNLEEAAGQLKEAGIPITKTNIRTLYQQLESPLIDGGVQIVKIREQKEKDDFTIIPTVSINIEILKVSEKQYFILAYLTVLKWISTWSGTQNLHTPVIMWWQKKLLAAPGDELNKILEDAASTLVGDFLVKLKEENREKEEKTDTGKPLAGKGK
jgi:hypothetical protein